MEQTAYSYEKMMDVVERLIQRYPFLKKTIIGKSIMGKEIIALEIGRGEKRICYNAAFHANEWITSPLLLHFLGEYAQAVMDRGELYGAQAMDLYEQTTLFVVPLVNPDGVDLVTGALTEGKDYEQAAEIGAAYSEIPFPDGWKANIRGVDLNLQFPADWELAREIKFEQGYQIPAPRDYVGEAPLSEPESRAMYEFTVRQEFALILAYHTQGEVIYWKYKDLEPECSREIAEYFGEVSGYAVEETPYASGNAGYKDWFILQYDKPGYTIEAGYGENPLPISDFAEIYRRNTGILVGGMTQIMRESFEC